MIALLHPITRDGTTIEQVRLFEPRAADIRAIADAEAAAPACTVRASLVTIERLTDLPSWAVELLSQDDLLAIGTACDGRFAWTQKH